MQDITDVRFDEFDTAYKTRKKRKVNKRANTATTSYDRSVNDKNRNRVGLKMSNYRRHKARQVAKIKFESWFDSLREKEQESPLPVPIGQNESLPDIVKPVLELKPPKRRKFDLSPNTIEIPQNKPDNIRRLKAGKDIDSATVHSPRPGELPATPKTRFGNGKTF